MNASLKKHAIDKGLDLIKFIFIVSTLCYLAVNMPTESEHLITIVAAFVLGGSELKSKLGF